MPHTVQAEDIQAAKVEGGGISVIFRIPSFHEW